MSTFRQLADSADAVSKGVSWSTSCSSQRYLGTYWIVPPSVTIVSCSTGRAFGVLCLAAWETLQICRWQMHIFIFTIADHPRGGRRHCVSVGGQLVPEEATADIKEGL
jgi:hypothetical protein